MLGLRRSKAGTALVAAVFATFISSLALAPQARAYIYWANALQDTIGRADLDGTRIDTDFISAGGDFNSIAAVDDAHIYWITNDGTIGRANLDGSGVDETFIPALGNLGGVAVDATHVYWTNTDTIGRANIDGTGVDQTFIAAGSSGLSGIAVDASHIYWTNRVGSGLDTNVGRANLDGSGVDRGFITGASASYDLAVDAGHVYWTNTYWGPLGTDTIGRADLDGTDVNQSFITGARFPQGLAVDDHHVYWTDTVAVDLLVEKDTIGRANTDGTGIDQAFITGLLQPWGVAVDSLTFPALSFPKTTIIAGPQGLTRKASPKFDFVSDRAGSTFECRLDADVFANCVPPKAYHDIADGPHDFKVRAIDAEGAVDPTPAERSFTVDATRPDTRITAGAPARTKRHESKFRFTSGEPDSSFECRLISRKFKVCLTPATVERLGQGKHIFQVRAIDAAGNIDATPAKDRFKVVR